MQGSLLTLTVILTGCTASMIVWSRICGAPHECDAIKSSVVALTFVFVWSGCSIFFWVLIAFWAAVKKFFS